MKTDAQVAQLARLLILYQQMYFILYTLLTLNLLMCTLAYSRGDMPGVRHAVAFALTAVVAMGLVWMTRRGAMSQQERSERVLEQLAAYLEREVASASSYHDRAKRSFAQDDVEFFLGARCALTDAQAELKRLRASQEPHPGDWRHDHPDNHRDVLILVKGRVMPEIGYYVDGRWISDGTGIVTVTHWMELPEVPV